MKKIKELIDQFMIQWRFTNRNVTRATILYWYIIVGSIGGILYAVFSAIFGWDMAYSFTPIYLLIGYFLTLFVKRNWNLLWLYLRDIDQGRFLLRLNDRTHFSDKHKLMLVSWVYPRRNNIRNEMWVKIGNLIRDGKLVTKRERNMHKKKIVSCPQQLLDGINQAILVDSLIYAHRNIRTLDPEIREIMNLTDENILAFNLQREINLCRTKESRKEIERLTRVGEQISKSKKL